MKPRWFRAAMMILGFSSLCLGGCLDANPGQVYHAHSAERARFDDACKKLAGVGQFTEFREEIRLDMAELRRLLKATDLERVRSRISFLTNRIQADSKAITQLIDPQFTVPGTDVKLHWRIRPEQMGLAPEGQRSIWNVMNAEVVGAYNWQGQASEIVAGTQVTFRRNAIEVVLTRSQVSALEACQLQDTIALDLLVTFRGYFGATSQMHAVLLAAPGDH